MVVNLPGPYESRTYHLRRSTRRETSIVCEDEDREVLVLKY